MTAKPRRDVFGVFQRRLRRILRWQHHTADILRTQRIHSDGRNNRAIHSSREPQQDFLEARLTHIVAQTLDHAAVVLFPSAWQADHVTLDDFPALARIGKLNNTHLFVKHTHLMRQRAMRIQCK